MSATSKEKVSSPETPRARKDGTTNRKANAHGTGNVVFLHPAATEPSAAAQHLDQSLDIEAIPIPIARFPGLMGVVPEQETVCLGWTALVQEIAPNPAPVITRKDRLPYYIAGRL